jgi:hypothetical protein
MSKRFVKAESCLNHIHPRQETLPAQEIGGVRPPQTAMRRDGTPEKPEFSAQQKTRPNEVLKKRLVSVRSLQTETLYPVNPRNAPITRIHNLRNPRNQQPLFTRPQ